MFTRCHDKYFDTLGTGQTEHKSISCCLLACSSIAIFECPPLVTPLEGRMSVAITFPHLSPHPKIKAPLFGNLSCLISCLFGILLHSLIIVALV